MGISEPIVASEAVCIGGNNYLELLRRVKPEDILF